MIPFYVGIEITDSKKVLMRECTSNTNRILMDIPEVVIDPSDGLTSMTGNTAETILLMPEDCYKKPFLTNLERAVGHSVEEPFEVEFTPLRKEPRPLTVRYEPDIKPYCTILPQTN